MSARALDLVELFAGRSRIARLASARGWHTASHDWNFDRDKAPSQHNAMDINGAAGFA